MAWNQLRLFPTKFGVQFVAENDYAQTLLNTVSAKKISAWRAHEHPEFVNALGKTITLHPLQEVRITIPTAESFEFQPYDIHSQYYYLLRARFQVRRDLIAVQMRTCRHPSQRYNISQSHLTEANLINDL